MKQNTMFGGPSIGLANSGKIKTEVGQMTPTMAVGVEEVYLSAQDTFRHVLELLPKVQHQMITSHLQLESYLKAIKSSGVYAIDTEVDGLNPRLDKIAGISIYTPGQSPAYVPINHSFYEGNLDSREFVRALSELDVFVIMHNSAYDRRVLFNYAQVWVPCTLDTMVAAHALNENEPKGLKYLWNKYCMDDQYEEKTYSDLFGGRKFSTFDPERVLVYATLDAYMTYQLGQFQMQYLNKKQPLCKELGLESVAHAFWEIEMPVLDVATRMEERGINFDLERNKELQVKYEEQMRIVEKKIHDYLDRLLPVIKDRIPPAKFHSLGNPVNIASGQQMATIIYDGMGLELSEQLKKSADVDAKKKGKSPNYRPTGKAAIEYYMEEYPTYKEFFDNLLEHRGISKIYGTYIIGLRKEIDPYSKRIHGNWNTIGTDTGRMSSRSPNLQNIPGRNADIRPTFIPTKGKVFVGADYSQQEPRLLAELSQDPVLMDNYLTNKDIYVTLISTAKKVPYETMTKEAHAKHIEEWEDNGKKGKAPINYRNQGKTLQLALSYGLGVDALSEQLDISRPEAEDLMSDFKIQLAGVFKYEDKLKDFARKHGYVNTVWGTKRRFPHYSLPEIIVKGIDGAPVSRHTYNLIVNSFNNVWKFNERASLVKQLEAMHGVKVIDNKELRGNDETRILNSVIQGSGAYMVKMALVKIDQDEIMNKIGAVPILAVHDELIVEVDREHAEMAKQRLEEIMLEAAYMVVKTLPFVAEGEINDKWEIED